MSLVTRLTTRLDLRHPIIAAPMDLVSGGLLAGTVSRAGGLGLVAGGYGDDYEWLEREFARAEGTRVGCGFISWSLVQDPGALHKALERLRPVVVLLSFGDPGPLALAVRASGAILMIQVQSLDLARRALDLGADIVVAQGVEAGGHVADSRSTLPLIPAVVDLVADRAPEVLVVAAGGIADGRGLAAALALGADGVLMGTRFWASRQALVPAEAQARMIAASGDDTVRTVVEDIASGHDWPRPFTGHVRARAQHRVGR
jgi:nitronate monooxygenase